MSFAAGYEAYFNDLIRKLGLTQWTDNVSLIMHHADEEWLEYIVKYGRENGLAYKWIQAANDELVERILLKQ